MGVNVDHSDVATYHSSTRSHPPRLTPRIVSVRDLIAQRLRRTNIVDQVHPSIVWMKHDGAVLQQTYHFWNVGAA